MGGDPGPQDPARGAGDFAGDILTAKRVPLFGREYEFPGFPEFGNDRGVKAGGDPGAALLRPLPVKGDRYGVPFLADEFPAGGDDFGNPGPGDIQRFGDQADPKRKGGE